VRSHLFHPTTGYSLPHAVRVADLIGRSTVFNSKSIGVQLQKYIQNVERKNRFFRLLNRMLFMAAQPEERFKVLQRFYHFHQTRIERFYAGDLKISDCIRILSGRPPVPIRKAVRCLIFRERKDVV
jgi:lycopene beta-cyclase